MEKKEKQKQVNKKVVLQELTTWLKKNLKKEFRRGLMTQEKIEEDYIDMIEAIEDGLLIFKDGKPEYTFRTPVFNKAEDEALKIKGAYEIRSRVKQADKALVMDGLDVDKKRGTFSLKLMSYITKLSISEIKDLESEDFDVLNQICSVF